MLKSLVKTMSKKEYKIKVLEGLDAVRQTAGMYIGNTEDGTGYHHMLAEVLDNSIDEFMANHCNKIIVTLYKDGSASVQDNGRGIPTYYMKEEKKSALEIVLTKLHAGGKFDKSNYEHSAGLHGVGVSVVNALSSRLDVVVKHDGVETSIAFESGKLVEKVREQKGRGTGTFVKFKPDGSIFKNVLCFDSDKVRDRLVEISYLCRGLEIVFVDENLEKKEQFYSENGICEFSKKIAPSPLIDEPIYFSVKKENIVVEISLQWMDDSSYSDVGKYYTNNILNLDGGSHMVGFKTGLTKTINSFISKSDLPKTWKVPLSGDDIREGLVSIVSLKHPAPRFSSQTKDKLVSEDARTAVESVISESLMAYFEANSNQAKRIVGRCINAYKAREAARKARETARPQNTKSLGFLPGKLADCSSNKMEECELFLVEGTSAGGSSIQARDRKMQAILPLKGKVLNIERSGFKKMLDNEELSNLVTALGCGLGKDFNSSSLRYGKVVLMSIDGEEPICVQKDGIASVVKFKDLKDNPGSVLTMDFLGNSKFSPIENVIVHKTDVDLYNIKTSYNREITVTGNHSVFIDKNNIPTLVEASSIAPGDKVYLGLPVFPETLCKKINVFEFFWERKNKKEFDKVIIKGPTVIDIIKKRIKKEHPIHGEERVKINKISRKFLISKRKEMNITVHQLAKLIGLKQGISVSEYERGVRNPMHSVFIKWLDILGIDKTKINFKIIDSIFERMLGTKPSNRNRTKNRIYLKDLTLEEMLSLTEKDFLTDNFGNGFGMNKFLDLDELFFFVLGFWIAEGSSGKTQIQWSTGPNDDFCINKIHEFAKKNGFISNFYEFKNTKGTCVRINNKSFRLFFNEFVGGIKHCQVKEIPQVVFSAANECKISFLKGWLLGDGTVNKNGISITTSSKFMARQLLWLFGNFGVVASNGYTKPHIIKSNNKKVKKEYLSGEAYHVWVGGSHLNKIKEVWINHRYSYILDSVKHRERMLLENYGDNVFLVKVKSVTKLDVRPEFVYDVSVPETQRFFCGDGLLGHNSDADVDGAHIRTLLLTFFFRQMPQLILSGNLFISVPPLFRLNYKNKPYYFKDEKPMQEFIKEKGINKDTVSIQRFKGLGEMSPEQLWETTMNPETRLLKRIVINNFIEADKIFGILMGSQVELRKDFIERFSEKAFLDI